MKRITVLLVVGAVAVVTTIGASSVWAKPQGPASAIREKALPALTWTPGDGLTRARASGQLSDAEYALVRAESLFHRQRITSRFGRLASPTRLDATLILRDLAIRVATLPDDLRVRALRVLARPTDPGDPDEYSVAEEAPACSTNVCVHYVASTDDAPDLTDTSPANGIPDYVDQASAVIEAVWQAEVIDAGYRAPKSDVDSTNNGGNAKLDVYLADVGADGLYGYCTSDDPNLPPGSYPYYDFSAYCVVDDDFDPGQFPGTNGVDALKVTAAHEFFHAVQFAYDTFEDMWLMESTATWMEEQVYDEIDDNRQYLPDSQLEKPAVPLDKGSGFGVYGNWIFWQFLTEDFDASIVLDTWAYADGAAGGPDKYSSQALSKAIADRTVDGKAWRFRWAYAEFGAWNAAPGDFYAEGQDGLYPTPPASKTVTLSGSKPTMAWSEFVLDHMTNRYVVVKRGSGIKTTAKLRISVDGPAYGTGTEASAVIFRADGTRKIVPLSIASDGDATKRVGFGKGAVTKVVIVLTNASARFDCWVDEQSPWSCLGDPLDDNKHFSTTARVIQ